MNMMMRALSYNRRMKKRGQNCEDMQDLIKVDMGKKLREKMPEINVPN